MLSEVFTALSVVLLCFQVASGRQPAGPEALADRFVRAWTRHDIDAFGSLFSDNTDWVTASAVKVRGGLPFRRGCRRALWVGQGDDDDCREHVGAAPGSPIRRSCCWNGRSRV